MTLARMAAVVGLMGAGLVGSHRLQASPVFERLGDLPGGYFSSQAAAISADGTVVVGRGLSNLGSEPFRWTAATGMVGLGHLPGNAHGSAYGVSADGSVIVGWTGLAFRWTETDGMTPLTGLLSSAADVSADGSIVVGGVYTGGWEPFRWTQSSGLVALEGLPGDYWNQAAAVSADGSVVVGTHAIDDSSFGAFRWTASDGMVGLGDLPGGGFYAGAYGTSVDGSVIVGQSRSALGMEAYRWTEATGLVGLGDLPGGQFESSASDVSSDGSVIVGSGHGASIWEAFIWDASNGMRNLQDLLMNDSSVDLTGWTLHSATGISADGRTIVGYGTNPNGNREAWIARIPEPTTILLLCIGSLALVPNRRGKRDVGHALVGARRRGCR